VWVWQVLDAVSTSPATRTATSPNRPATRAATLLRVLRDLLPTIRVPVHVFYAAADPLALVANGE
jgi:hypothetical protein